MGAADESNLEHLVQELFENLRQTAWVFEYEGGREGAKLACRAVAHFVLKSGRSPQLAIHLMAIAEGFGDLQRGVVPRLFSLEPEPSERDRSVERKWNQKWAAAILDYFVKNGEGENAAAVRIARAVDGWPSFKNQKINRDTVKNWRKHFIGAAPEVRKDFDALCAGLQSNPNAKDVIAKALQYGPPGTAKS